MCCPTSLLLGARSHNAQESAEQRDADASPHICRGSLCLTHARGMGPGPKAGGGHGAAPNANHDGLQTRTDGSSWFALVARLALAATETSKMCRSSPAACRFVAALTMSVREQTPAHQQAYAY